MSDGADWTSAGRLFQSRGLAAAKERSPTVTSLHERVLSVKNSQNHFEFSAFSILGV